MPSFFYTDLKTPHKTLALPLWPHLAATLAERRGFGNAEGWEKAQLVVYDFDSLTDSDFIGQAQLGSWTEGKGSHERVFCVFACVMFFVLFVEVGGDCRSL